jgi:anti-sigma regulatory factor (Ser/Thr protein kinase)
VSALTLPPVRRSILPLPRTIHCPALARHHVTALARAWHVQIDLDALELVASELATNAYRHAKPPATGRDGILVTFEIGARHVVLTVHDEDCTPVSTARPFEGWDPQVGGLGLLMVRELTARCGFRYAQINSPGRSGKDAWASWDTNPFYSGWTS